jgi:hypothetical protein
MTQIRAMQTGISIEKIYGALQSLQQLWSEKIKKMQQQL